jgi:hypothetical protein
MVDVVLELGSPHFEFLDFLIVGEIYLLLDSIDFVIEPVVLVEKIPEVIVRCLKPTNHFAMFRELSQDWMMKVHWTDLLVVVVELQARRRDAWDVIWQKPAWPQRPKWGKLTAEGLGASPKYSADGRLPGSLLSNSIRSSRACGYEYNITASFDPVKLFFRSIEQNSHQKNHHGQSLNSGASPGLDFGGTAVLHMLANSANLPGQGAFHCLLP